MTRHVVAAAGEIPSGGRKRVEIRGQAVVVFHVGGEFFALLDRCPHQGGRLSAGKLTRRIESSGPGDYRCAPGDLIRCPWHGWAFDLRTGQSWCEPGRWRTRRYPVTIESGAEVLQGPYAAERFEVRVEDDYVVIDA